MAKGESQISTCMMFVPMHRFCTSVISQYDQTHLKMVSSSALFCSYSNNSALPSIRLTLFPMMEGRVKGGIGDQLTITWTCR